jgi:Cd2+/Zn2+-exporting ATPase
VRHAEKKAIPITDVEGFRSLTGAGASGQFQGKNLYVGSVNLFEGSLKHSLTTVQAKSERLQDQGKTVVIVGDDEAPWALIALRDSPRSNSRAAVEALRATGVKRVMMLTGDTKRTAHAIAKETDVDDVFASLSPEGKVEKVRELTARHGQVAMVGDGVNDAPALAEASIGIAMGAAGTDVALETADVALMADDLERVAYAIALAKRNRTVVRQNLALSAVVIGFLVVGAVAGVFTLPLAVVAHEVSEFVVIGSGLRMLRG